jgi:hypothetical protein
VSDPLGLNRAEWSMRLPMMSPARRLAHEERARRNVAQLEVDKLLGYQGDTDGVTVRFTSPVTFFYSALDAELDRIIRSMNMRTS